MLEWKAAFMKNDVINLEILLPATHNATEAVASMAD
jgi:hypothetical protein